MKQKTTTTLTTLALVVLAVLGIAAFTGYLPAQKMQVDLGGGVQAPPVGGIGYATTVTVSAQNALTGAAVTDAGVWLYSDSNDFAVLDAGPVTGTYTVSSAAPNTFKGYAMIGNDANQGSDQGTEWYYRKIPAQYTNKGAYQIYDPSGAARVRLQPEATSVTISGYDDGTSESTLNVSVGTAIVTSTEIKIQPAASTTLGNPDFSNPIGVCINESTAGTFDEIKPTNNAGSFAVPAFLKGTNVLGCYVLSTGALSDDTDPTTNLEYRFSLTIDPNSNPTDGMVSTISVLDKTYFLDDNNVWQAGFGDDSEKGTDYDPGMATASAVKLLYFA